MRIGALLMPTGKTSAADPDPPVPPGRRLLSWMPALAGMAAIFYASSLPGSEINLPAFPHSDKLAHFLAYFALGWLISLRHFLQRRRPFHLDFLGIAVGALYGIGDEIHQIFVPFRDFSFLDMLADGLGAAAACRVYGAFFGSGRRAGDHPGGGTGS